MYVGLQRVLGHITYQLTPHKLVVIVIVRLSGGTWGIAAASAIARVRARSRRGS